MADNHRAFVDPTCLFLMEQNAPQNISLLGLSLTQPKQTHQSALIHLHQVKALNKCDRIISFHRTQQSPPIHTYKRY